MNNEFDSATPITSDTAYAGSETVSNDDTISVLNGLIETCKDGQEGYQQAAEGVERSDLKSLFYEFSQQRSQFTGELQSLVRELGGDPETSGSFTGALHRGWINIKSAVTGQDEHAILNECERGEDSAKAAYKSALENNLPSNIAETVQNQFGSVQAAHDRVKALRDAGRNETSTSATSGF